MYRYVSISVLFLTCLNLSGAADSSDSPPMDAPIKGMMDAMASLATTLEESRSAVILAAIKNEKVEALTRMLETFKPDASHMAAAATTSVEIVMLLHRHGGPIDELDAAEVTPLGHAALAGNHEIVVYLCAQGAEVNKRMRSKSTPLHAAALGGNFSVIDELLSRYADPTAKDAQGRTPLMRALEKEHAPAALMLLETGIALDAKDNAGRSVADYAKTHLPIAAEKHRKRFNALLQPK